MWRYGMEMLSTLLALCEDNLLNDSPHKVSVMRALVHTLTYYWRNGRDVGGLSHYAYAAFLLWCIEEHMFNKLHIDGLV